MDDTNKRIKTSRKAVLDSKQRPVLSCTPCRLRKVKCDRIKPCRACCIIGKPENCDFTVSEHTREAISQNEEIQRLRKRITELESQGNFLETSTTGRQAGNEHGTLPVRGTPNLSDSTALVALTRSTVPLKIVEMGFLERFLDRYSPVVPGARFWIRSVAESINDEASTVSGIIRALVIGYCGREDKNIDLQNQAKALYSQVLYRIQRDLNTPERCDEPETLYATMVASLFEILILADFKSYWIHIEGTGRLIHHRGPQRYTTGLEHDTLRYYRFFALTLSSLRKEPSFLSLPAWKAIPWSYGYPSKDLMDLIMDIMLDIPGLYQEDSKLLREYHSQSTESQLALEAARMKLTIQAQSIFDRLTDWEEQWGRTYPGVQEATERALASTVPADASLGLDFIPFIDPAQSQATTLCYAGKLLILIILHKRQIETPVNLQELLANRVFNHLEHQLSVASDYFSVTRTFYPLGILSTMPALNPKAKAWIVNFVRTLRTQFGIGHAITIPVEEMSRQVQKLSAANHSP